MTQATYICYVYADYSTLLSIAENFNPKLEKGQLDVEVYDWGEMEIMMHIEIEDGVDPYAVLAGDASPWGKDYDRQWRGKDYYDERKIERAINLAIKPEDPLAKYRIVHEGWEVYE